MNMQKPTGPLGNKRGIGFGILMTIVTLGIYCYWWSYATFEELKSHRNGQGIGGLIALILMFVGGSIAIPLLGEQGRAGSGGSAGSSKLGGSK